MILSDLQGVNKPIHYYALDIAHQALTSSLAELRERFVDCPAITITGLLGTYDDCIEWLPSLRQFGHQSVTILWLGNSIGNSGSQGEASAFLRRFGGASKKAGLACQFIVSIDTCKDKGKIARTYGSDTPEYVDLALNVLLAANKILGYKAFHVDDWETDNWMDEREQTLHTCLVPKRDIVITLGLGEASSMSLAFKRGQRMQFNTTGKWRAESVADMSRRAGFFVRRMWQDKAGDCGIFLLVQDEKQAEDA
ncbi:histidine-specific methyltransferase [Xylariaceae sp. FL0255]|nr:histidine-specific methyltransferase [Xylariaceae sp. FL0255]